MGGGAGLTQKLFDDEMIEYRYILEFKRDRINVCTSLEDDMVTDRT